MGSQLEILLPTHKNQLRISWVENSFGWSHLNCFKKFVRNGSILDIRANAHVDKYAKEAAARAAAARAAATRLTRERAFQG